MFIPPALVLGCNTPHGLDVLSDWIQEHTGVAPDFVSASWSDRSVSNYGNGYGDSYADGVGNGYGHGGGSGYGYTNGYGYSFGHGDGYGYGTGCGDGSGYGYGDDYYR